MATDETVQDPPKPGFGTRDPKIRGSSKIGRSKGSCILRSFFPAGGRTFIFCAANAHNSAHKSAHNPRRDLCQRSRWSRFLTKRPANQNAHIKAHMKAHMKAHIKAHIMAHILAHIFLHLTPLGGLHPDS
jgi:hypothetical protein